MTSARRDSTPEPRSPTATARHRAKRVPLVIVAGLAAAGKAEAWRHLLRGGGPFALVAFGLGLVTSVLRTNPVGLAVSLAVLTALVVHPAILVGIGFAVALCAVLLAVFTLIGTVLMARQPGGAGRRH